MKLTQTVIAALGCGFQQAVSRSMNPKRWLDTRIRHRLVGNIHLEDDVPIPKDIDVVAKAKEEAKLFLREVGERLSKIPAPRPKGATGHPSCPNDPKDLAELLDVEYHEGDSLQRVFAWYVVKQIERLKGVIGRAQSCKFWEDLSKLLDNEWLPVWVWAVPVYGIITSLLGFG